jgi:hypothetical protein
MLLQLALTLHSSLDEDVSVDSIYVVAYRARRSVEMRVVRCATGAGVTGGGTDVVSEVVASKRFIRCFPMDRFSSSLADLRGPTSSSWWTRPFLPTLPSVPQEPRPPIAHAASPSQSHPSHSCRAHLRAGSPTRSSPSRLAHLSDRPVRPHQPRAPVAPVLASSLFYRYPIPRPSLSVLCRARSSFATSCPIA